MEKPRLITILSKTSLRYSYWKLSWPKASTMSYEVLYIAKGGVTLNIPLCDCSPTIMTLQLLYDYYIQLSTLELPLDKMLRTIYTCTHVRLNRLEQAMQDINKTRTDQIFDILAMIDDGKMIPSLVIHDGVRPLKGDILLKANSCLCCIRVH